MDKLMSSSWGVACNFDENQNLLSVLCGRSGVPGRVPFSGFSRPEYYAQMRNNETKTLSKKRKAISNPPPIEPRNVSKASEMVEMETDNDTLRPEQIEQWEAQNPIVNHSQIPGFKLRKQLQKQIKEGKCL